MRWLERGLLIVGAVLAGWCGVVLLEADYFNALPVPNPTGRGATTLPGEEPTAANRREPAAAPGSWVARLDAPSVHLSATVLEGSDDETLRRGAGHIEETPLPGEPGNVGIAGHRDTVFRPVRLLREGDPLEVTTSAGTYLYRVTRTMIVDPDDVYVLDPADHPTLTLVTCYPFDFIGHAPRRFIVQADLMGHKPPPDR